MTQSYIQSFVNGFAAALQLPAPDSRLAAIRERTEKGSRLGVAIDQPLSDSKPVDIALTTFDYAAQLMRMRSAREQRKVFPMESNLRTVRPLSQAQYAKTTFRNYQASLSYPQKVRQVVAMQHRLVPIYASRGKVIVPWAIGE